MREYNEVPNMSLPILKSLGLNNTESQIYELLLQIGEVPAYEVVTRSEMKRPTVYKALYDLKKKGLVSMRDIKKIIHFKAVSPTKLLQIVEQEIEKRELVREDIRALLPSMLEMYNLAVEKPVVTTFEGVRGLKKMYQDTILVGKPIFAVLQTAEVDPELYAWLTRHYTKARVKAGIKAQVIVASGKWSGEYQSKDEKEFRETVLVPSNLYPFAHEVDIYGDKVAFMNYKKDNPLIGIIIQHPEIAQTMKAWFDLAWVGAQSIKGSKKEG